MKIQALDTFRGLAILMVFLYHVMGFVFGTTFFPWDGWISDFGSPPMNNRFYLFLPLIYGHGGVAVFFVVSGLCIHLSYLHNSSWKAFFVRRFLRIFPPYLFALALFVFLSEERGPLQILSHLFMVHNLYGETFYGINASFWTIAVEFQLYVLFPLLLLMSRKMDWLTVLVVTGLVEGLIRVAASLGYGVMFDVYVTGSPFAYWFSWSLGAYLAEKVASNNVTQVSWLAVSIVAFLAMFVNHFTALLWFSFPLFSLATFMALSNIILHNGETKDSFVLRHLRFAGICSYSFYLLHQPLLFLWIMAAKNIRDSPLALMLMAFPCWFAVLGLSYLSYRFIEVPSITLGRNIFLRYKVRQIKTS